MSTRKFYDSEEYLEKTRQLEAILDGKVTGLDLSGDCYHIKGETQEQLVFVAVQQMKLFEHLADFDCRTIKLINYGRPATSLLYFTKHKYFLKKNVEPGMVEEILTGVIQGLRELLRPESEEQVDRLAVLEQIEHYQAMRDRITQYQFAFSNYARHYCYSYVSYKYTQNGKVKSANSHLIKHTRDADGEIVMERTNVIFVDEVALAKPTAYANKQVVEYLASFPEVIPCGKFELYIK